MKEEKGKKVGGEDWGKEVGKSRQKKQETEGQTQKWSLSEKKIFYPNKLLKMCYSM